ncbi:hypothetical protein [Candidatus Thiodiazotropha sp. LNASS1]|uniref:hypothetical protein n=1 Tax=Candidatus Thiodiazotropha sp. LNASS1 TaxID=3096260 RepID=UPI0034DFFB8D
MDKIEAIIFDCIYDLQSKIGDMVDEDFEGIFNRPHHDIDKLTLKGSLFALYKSDYIFFVDREGIQHQPKKTENIEDGWFVAMTKEGGRLWESYSNPNWEKYVSIDCDVSEDGTAEIVTIEAGSKEIIEFIISETLTHLKKSSITNILVIRPWKPTYWKILPEGFSVAIDNINDVSDKIALVTSKINWKSKV